MNYQLLSNSNVKLETTKKYIYFTTKQNLELFKVKQFHHDSSQTENTIAEQPVLCTTLHFTIMSLKLYGYSEQ